MAAHVPLHLQHPPMLEMTTGMSVHIPLTLELYSTDLLWDGQDCIANEARHC